jgi:hypothetical protein
MALLIGRDTRSVVTDASRPKHTSTRAHAFVLLSRSRRARVHRVRTRVPPGAHHTHCFGSVRGAPGTNPGGPRSPAQACSGAPRPATGPEPDSRLPPSTLDTPATTGDRTRSPSIQTAYVSGPPIGLRTGHLSGQLYIYIYASDFSPTERRHVIEPTPPAHTSRGMPPRPLDHRDIYLSIYLYIYIYIYIYNT